MRCSFFFYVNNLACFFISMPTFLASHCTTDGMHLSDNVWNPGAFRAAKTGKNWTAFPDYSAKPHSRQRAAAHVLLRKPINNCEAILVDNVEIYGSALLTYSLATFFLACLVILHFWERWTLWPKKWCSCSWMVRNICLSTRCPSTGLHEVNFYAFIDRGRWVEDTPWMCILNPMVLKNYIILLGCSDCRKINWGWNVDLWDLGQSVNY